MARKSAVKNSITDEESTANRKFSGLDYFKLFLFALFFLPSIFPMMVGVLPAIFLSVGYYKTKRNGHFYSMDVAIYYSKIYIKFIIFICVVSFFFTMSENIYGSLFYERIMIDIGRLVLSYFYLLIFHYLFCVPLWRHDEWVANNGIFGKRKKTKDISDQEPKLPIIKRQRLKNYSVAEELTKWADLKKGGHITEEEFQRIKEKLLK